MYPSLPPALAQGSGHCCGPPDLQAGAHRFAGDLHGCVQSFLCSHWDGERFGRASRSPRRRKLEDTVGRFQEQQPRSPSSLVAMILLTLWEIYPNVLCKILVLDCLDMELQVFSIQGDWWVLGEEMMTRRLRSSSCGRKQGILANLQMLQFADIGEVHLHRGFGGVHPYVSAVDVIGHPLPISTNMRADHFGLLSVLTATFLRIQSYLKCLAAWHGHEWPQSSTKKGPTKGSGPSGSPEVEIPILYGEITDWQAL